MSTLKKGEGGSWIQRQQQQGQQGPTHHATAQGGRHLACLAHAWFARFHKKEISFLLATPVRNMASFRFRGNYSSLNNTRTC